MFGKNEIVGQKFFSSFQGRDTLLVTSIFYTIQGEGPFAGHPAVFVRLAKCNLACSFCDTFFDAGQEMSFGEIIDTAYFRIKAAVDEAQMQPNAFRDVVLVITGGEPLLQENIKRFIRFTYEFEFAAIQIESNGTIYQDIPITATLVVSPKCLEKDGVPVRYLKPNEKMLEQADVLKFVISADPSSPYHTIPEWAYEWKKEDPHNREIYISPMNVYNDVPKAAKDARSKNVDIMLDERSLIDEKVSWWEPGLLNMEANRANHEYAAQFCMKHKLKLNLQMHLYTSIA